MLIVLGIAVLASSQPQTAYLSSGPPHPQRPPRSYYGSLYSAYGPPVVPPVGHALPPVGPVVAPAAPPHGYYSPYGSQYYRGGPATVKPPSTFIGKPPPPPMAVAVASVKHPSARYQPESSETWSSATWLPIG